MCTMERFKGKIIVAFCFLIGYAVSITAQNLSTYEQKRYELANNTLSAMAEEDPYFAIAFGVLREKKINEDGPFEDPMLDVYFAESVIEAVGQGSSFMGANNFAQYAQKQAFKQLYQSWKTKRVALDKTRTASDIEHERRLKSKPRAGSVGEMTFHLKKKFGIWAKKGEFEKTIEYENRLNSTGIYYFDSLCIAISDEIWFWVKSQYFTADSKYDADNEIYTIELTYGDSVIGKKKIIGECKMPVEVAKKFSAKRLFITDAQVVGGLIVPKRLSVWQYYDGYHRYDFVFPEIPNATSFRICLKDIGLNYTGNIDTLLNHCFTYSDYYQLQTELAFSLIDECRKTKAKLKDLEKEYADAAAKYIIRFSDEDDRSYKESDGIFSQWLNYGNNFYGWLGERNYKYTRYGTDIKTEIIFGNRDGGSYWNLEEVVRNLLNVSHEEIEYKLQFEGEYYNYSDYLKDLYNLQALINHASKELRETIEKKLCYDLNEFFNKIDKQVTEYKKESQRISNYSTGMKEFEEKHLESKYFFNETNRYKSYYVGEPDDRIFYGIIKDIAFDNNQIIFILPGNEQLKDSIIANNLKLSNGNTYSGVKKDDIFCSNEGTTILYRTSISEYNYNKEFFNSDKGDIVLIHNEKTYMLSDEVQRALIENGYFNDNK